jgi:hypothetical protein
MVPVRSITLGLDEPHPLGPDVVPHAAALLGRAQTAFEGAGYDVQSVRLSTRPVFWDMAGLGPGAIARYADDLAGELKAAGIPFCSLGQAPIGSPTEATEAAAVAIASHQALNCTVEVASVDGDLSLEAARTAARVVLRLARGTEEGFGNFNFAALACVRPGTPFLPAAYHQGPPALSVALQGAGVVAEALAGGAGLDEVTARVKAALVRHAGPVAALAGGLAQGLGVGFGGVDLSPAPDGQDSIAAALEMAGHGPLGTPGTLALAGALTAALKGTGLPTCGYCGLMLPVMEDSLLARRWEEGRVNLDQLLAYSAVCGTGLDTVPLPGDCSEKDLTSLICDVATLAVRLRKPLSARLLPVPGKSAGDRTEFSSPYIVNTLVKPI